MSRAQQDTFIDDTDEFCPLCVEEFDLSDRNFKPCPCGYQICQFCFNNIRTNLNGLCPACRRPYDDSTIEYKVISPDEYKAEAQKKTRLNAERRQREAQKREIEAQNRKHLAGLRVIQKNLVYVVGLNPRIKEEDLLQTLRGEQYFGQYGKIVKIVVNKRTAQEPGGSYNDSGKNSGGMGVYVTFARKQDAATCIAAVDGSVNGDRVLRATYGTTKYCSAYLRNETCPNKNCMFLHEPGEEAESFSRLDLSSINASQRPPAGQASGSSAAPPAQQPIAAATSHHHPTPQPHPVRSNSTQPVATQEHHEGSALPPTVSWASKNPPTPASRAAVPVHPGQSHTPANVATPSPRTAPSQLARGYEAGKSNLGGQNQGSQKAQPKPSPAPAQAKAKTPSPPPPPPPPAQKPPTPAPVPSPANVNSSAQDGPQAQPVQEPKAAPQPAPTEPPLPQINLNPKGPSEVEKSFMQFAECFKHVSLPNFKFVFSSGNLLSPEDVEIIKKMPIFFDQTGGAKRKNIFTRPDQDDIRLKLFQAAQQQQQVQQQSAQQLQAQQVQHVAQQQQVQQQQQQQAQQQQAQQQQQQQAAQQAQQQAQQAQQQAQQAQQQAQQAQHQAQQQQLQQQNQQQQQLQLPHQQGLPGSAALALAQAQGTTRHLTQQQQLQMMLKNSVQGQGLGYQQEGLQQQNLRAHTPGNPLNALPGGATQVNHQFNPFSGGPLPQQSAGGMHARQSSRYTFANDNPSNATANVKPTANPQHMAQQQLMMPQHQQTPLTAAQFYGLGATGMQAPPPGLKSAPTPPAPGMGMMSGVFGQQSALGIQGHPASHSKTDGGAEFFQQLIRGRENKFGADLVDPSILQARVAAPQQQHHQLHQQLQTGVQGQAQQGGYNNPVFFNRGGSNWP